VRRSNATHVTALRGRISDCLAARKRSS
jgi:hypothetical protein